MNNINIQNNILNLHEIENIDNILIKNILKFEYNKVYTNLGEKDKNFYWFNYYSRVLFSKCKNLDNNLEIWINNLIQEITNNESLNKDINIDIKAFIDLLFYGLLNFFIKENWTGPSFYKVNCEDKYIREKVKPNTEDYQSKVKEKYDIEFLKEIDIKNYNKEVEEINLKIVKSEEYMDYRSNYFDDILMINGEDYKKILKYLNFFIIVKLYFKIKFNKENDNYFYIIMYARLNAIHQKFMDNNCIDLKNLIFNNFKKGIELIIENGTMKVEYIAMLKIEFANNLIQYYKYNYSKKLILESLSILGIEINFTGKLGIRTKYQSFKVAHLTVEVKNKEIKDEEGIEDLENKPIQPSNVKLDEIFDNILYEKPVLSEDIIKDKNNIFHNIAILSLVNHLLKSSVIEDMHRQEAMSYINKSMEVFKNWTVFSQSLILRSIIEYSFPKTIERAMMQLEQLNIDWLSKESNFFERNRYLNYVNYPMRFEFYILHADRYKQTGCYLSAANLLAEIKLFEEAVEYKLLGGRKEEAIDFLKDNIKNLETAKIQCILGDIYQEEKYYLKAWELGKNKYARAKRSLGLLYLKKKDFENAEKSFLETLEINDYQFKCWFNLGYIYMYKSNFKQAVTAFSKCIEIDDSDVDSWANLSGLYHKMGENKKAYETSKQAVGKRKNDFRLWYNLMVFSLPNQKVMDFIKAMSMLLNLNKKDYIEEFLIKKINIIFNILLDKAKNDYKNIRLCEIAENKIILIYDQLSAFLPEKEFIWKLISEFYDLKIELLDLKRMHTKEFFVNKVEDYDLKINEFKDKSIEYLLTSNQIILKQNYQQDKKILSNLHESSKNWFEKINMIKFDNLDHKLKFDKHIEFLNTIFVKFNLEKIN